jgi:hypothetical protein
MISDFYPFQDNKKVTAAMWNELITAIQNGSFFLDETVIGGEIHSLVDRVEALELRMDYQESIKAWRTIREQFILTENQEYVQLTHTPLLDSENLILNGISLAKNGIPLGFVGDYYVEGSRIQFTAERILNIEAGDQLVIIYQFEVV